MTTERTPRDAAREPVPVGEGEVVAHVDAGARPGHAAASDERGESAGRRELIGEPVADADAAAAAARARRPRLGEQAFEGEPERLLAGPQRRRGRGRRAERQHGQRGGQGERGRAANGHLESLHER